MESSLPSIACTAAAIRCWDSRSREVAKMLKMVSCAADPGGSPSTASLESFVLNRKCLHCLNHRQCHTVSSSALPLWRLIWIHSAPPLLTLMILTSGLHCSLQSQMYWFFYLIFSLFNILGNFIFFFYHQVPWFFSPNVCFAVKPML